MQQRTSRNPHYGNDSGTFDSDVAVNRERALEIQRTALGDWIASMAEASPEARLFDRSGVAAAAVPACPDRSIPNSVSYRDPGALTDSLGELAAFYAEAGVRAWTVWVPEFDGEAIAALEAAGHVFDGEPLAMALELERWQPREVGDLDWSVTDDPSEFGRINDLAYGVAPGDGYAGGLVRKADALRLYQARVDGTVACVLGTIDHSPSPAGTGGDLGFYFVATDPAHQGRGLATRLMSVVLADARERGLATSSLQASGAGEPVYRALGFAPLFRLRLYERRAR